MKRTVLVLRAAAMVVAALPLCAFADTASPGGIIFTMTDYRLNGHTADNLPFSKRECSMCLPLSLPIWA